MTPSQKALATALLEKHGPVNAHKAMLTAGYGVTLDQVRGIYNARYLAKKPCPDCAAPIGIKASACRSCTTRRRYADPTYSERVRQRVIAAKAKALAPMPADFPVMAQQKINIELEQHYAVSKHVVARWRAECGAPHPKRPLRPAPAHFASAARQHSVAKLETLFGVGPVVVRRWLKETGVTRRPLAIARVNYKPAPVIKHVESSLAGRAVDECLQRFGPVYRCTPTGRPDKDGSHWNRGGRILTDDEVIDRARRNGWSPDDWERIAA